MALILVWIFRIKFYKCLLILLNDFLVRVVHFNRTSQLPDALRGTYSSSSGSVGITQPGSDVTDLLEKQSDLINYLKDYNAKLNQKIMILNTQLNQHSTTSP